MARIKGHYDARVIVDFDFDDSTPGLKRFEDIKEGVEKEFSKELKKCIEAEVYDFGKVKIKQKCAELHVIHEDVLDKEEKET